MSSQSKLVPKLRFPEFSDEWQTVSFKDVFERVTRKNKENNQNILTISAQQGLVSQEKFFNKIVAAKNVTNYYLLHKNDYAYNKSYSKGYPMGAIKRLIYDEKGVVSTLYICFKLKNGTENFYDQYFSTGNLNPEIEKIAQEGARNHGLLNMSVGDFFEINIITPSEPEQEKIAGLLTVVDEKIDILEQKIKLIQKYKKGLMQQIFSQKLRFKDANGQNYPAWQTKKLGEIGPVSMCKRIFKEQTKITGEIPFYKIGTFGGNADAFIDFDIYNEYRQKYSFPKTGEILISAAGTIGRLVIFDGLPAYFQDSNIVWIANNEKIVINKFLYYCYANIQWKTADTTIARLYNDILKNITINIPEIIEQQKIADFLSAIDEKIDLENNKLTQAKLFKKSLLQRMFV